MLSTKRIMCPDKYQKLVFGDQLIEIIPELKRYQKKIENFILDQIDNPSKNLAELHHSIKISEKKLTEKMLKGGNVAYLEDTLNEIYEDGILCLQDTAIEKLLTQLPPNNLQSALNLYPQANHLTPRQKLSLSRFTENCAWQSEYQSILSKTTRDDYSLNLGALLVIDSKLINHLGVDPGVAMKPWGLSHNKETGVIMIFDQNEELSTPNLLLYSVFLHYCFEIYYFAKFIERAESNQTGSIAVSVIKNKNSQISFLKDGNAHDETMYWRETVDYLIENGTIDHYFSTNPKRFPFNPDGQSLHFVDALWNMNNVDGHNSHTYHLQHECWLDLLHTISGATDEEFKAMIDKSLNDDNHLFLEKVLRLSK